MIISVVVISILFSGFRYFQAKVEENKLKEDTITYLLDKGYDEQTDIAKMSIVHLGQGKERKAVVITFKDEPMVDYFYMYKRGSEEISQVDVVDKGTEQPYKHIEEK